MSGDYQNDPVFRRIVDQRVRNNIMAELSHLAQGDSAASARGFEEYFEAFFDNVPYEGPHPNCAMTVQEFAALERFLAAFRSACDDTPQTMSEAAFMATGWPARLAPLAREALEVFLVRGYLSNEEAQDR